MLHHPYFMMRLPIVLLALWVVYRGLRRERPLRNVARLSIGAFKLLLFVALLGFSGCTSSETLAVAHGPLFALNPTHWQPTAKDLKVPPPVVNP